MLQAEGWTWGKDPCKLVCLFSVGHRTGRQHLDESGAIPQANGFNSFFRYSSSVWVADSSPLQLNMITDLLIPFSHLWSEMNWYWRISFEVLEEDGLLQCWIRPIPYNPQPLWWYMQKPWGAEESGSEGNWKAQTKDERNWTWKVNTALNIYWTEILPKSDRTAVTNQGLWVQAARQSPHLPRDLTAGLTQSHLTCISYSNILGRAGAVSWVGGKKQTLLVYSQVLLLKLVAPIRCHSDKYLFKNKSGTRATPPPCS